MSHINGHALEGGEAPRELNLEVLSLKKAALLLRAINHPLRLQMLQELHQHAGINVTAFYQMLRLEQSVASQHLAILRRAGLVRTKRRARHIHYFVNYEQLKKLQYHATALVS